MKTILKRIFRSQGGFTLIELLAVLAIIGVLSGIVTAAVSGTKGASVESQVQSDGKATATATDNYITGSLEKAFPDLPLAGESKTAAVIKVGGDLGVGVTLLDSTGKAIDGGTTLLSVIQSKSGDLVAARRAIDFTATTESYQKDGSIGASALVPDFLVEKPSSVKLEGAATRKLDDNPIPEFLWLYAVGAPGSERENRRTEVYRLDKAVCAVSDFNFASNFSSLSAKVTSTKSDLTIAVADLVTAKAAFDKAKAALKDEQTILDRLIGAGEGTSTAGKAAKDKVTAAQTTLHAKEVDQLKAQMTVTGGANTTVAAVTKADGTGSIVAVTVGPVTLTVGAKITIEVVPSGGFASPAVAVSNYKGRVGEAKDAISALTGEQNIENGTAIGANAGCTGSNKVMTLTYKRVF